MDTKRTTELDQMVSAYLQRPVRSYEEALKARESAKPAEASYMRLVTDQPPKSE